MTTSADRLHNQGRASARQSNRPRSAPRRVLAVILLPALVVAIAAASTVRVRAQIFGGVVFDPTNYANALERFAQLEQQYSQLVTTYQQIRTQYLLLLRQSQKLPFDLEARYRSLRTPWRPLVATSTYGTTADWIDAANTGHNPLDAYTRATQELASYAGALAGVSTAETARIESRYDRTQLADGALTTALQALGRLRFHEGSVEATIRNLEADAYSGNPDVNTQIAVLNKINATGVTAARLAKDTNYLLVSLLEGQMLDATNRRDAAVEGINAHVAFLQEARPLLARTTADTTTALTTFRIP